MQMRLSHPTISNNIISGFIILRIIWGELVLIFRSISQILNGNKNSLISEGVYHQSHFLGVRCGLSEHSYILHSKITVPNI